MSDVRRVRFDVQRVMTLRQAHDDAVADSIDDVNRSRQDMQVVCI